MVITAVTYNFTDGVGNTAFASEVNTNYEDLVKVLDPTKIVGTTGLDGSNVNTGATNEILVNTNAIYISAIYTFSTNPVFNSNAILDAYLSANVMLLDSTQTVTGEKTFDLAIEKLKIPVRSAHPTLAVDDNSIYLLSTDSTAYIYKHGTGSIKLDTNTFQPLNPLYVYNGTGVIDENSPLVLQVECKSGFVASTSTAVISLIGLNFPSYVYTELAQHTHSIATGALANGAVTGFTHTHSTDIGHTHTGTFASSTHTHTTTHSHSLGLNTDYETTDDHRHSISFNTNGMNGVSTHLHTTSANIGSGTASITNTDIDHTHAISGNTAYAEGSNANHRHGISGNTDSAIAVSGAPSATTSVSSYTGSKTSGNNSAISPIVSTALTGSTGTAGILGNTLNDTKKVDITTATKIYISQDISAGWGTATVLDSGTLAGLLNIVGGNGTGAMDISPYLLAGMNYIKIVDETVKKGGTISYHIRTE